MTEVQGWIQLAIAFLSLVVALLALRKSGSARKDVDEIRANPLIRSLLVQYGRRGGGGV